MGGAAIVSGTPATTRRSLAGLRVLVVDDIDDTRELVALVLERAGARTVAVSSALEALAALEQGSIDVVVSDIGLPGMDGYELMARIRALPPERGGNVRAVAFTGYASPKDAARAQAAGFEGWVSKPIDAAELLDAIVKLRGGTSA